MPEHETNSASAADDQQHKLLYRIRGLRKTYGIKRIPEAAFCETNSSKAKALSEATSSGEHWRTVCSPCDQDCLECPALWKLHVDRLEIPRGGITGILGISGSGKSTLLHVLGLLDSPDSDTEKLSINVATDAGRADWRTFCQGKWKDGLSPNDLRRRLFGFVFQAANLTANLTARENVALPLKLAGVPPRVADERAVAALRNLQVPEPRFNALPRHLSGGQQQRVAVARALARDPVVLMADEPTGNLDQATAEAVMESLKDWQAKAPSVKTVLLITHNAGHANKYADRVVEVSDGRARWMTAQERRTLGQSPTSIATTEREAVR